MQSPETKLYAALINLAEFPTDTLPSPSEPCYDFSGDQHGMLLRFARRMLLRQSLQMEKEDYDNFFTLFSTLDTEAIPSAEDTSKGWSITLRSTIRPSLIYYIQAGDFLADRRGHDAWTILALGHWINQGLQIEFLWGNHELIFFKMLLYYMVGNEHANMRGDKVAFFISGKRFIDSLNSMNGATKEIIFKHLENIIKRTSLAKILRLDSRCILMAHTPGLFEYYHTLLDDFKVENRTTLEASLAELNEKLRSQLLQLIDAFRKKEWQALEESDSDIIKAQTWLFSTPLHEFLHIRKTHIAHLDQAPWNEIQLPIEYLHGHTGFHGAEVTTTADWERKNSSLNEGTDPACHLSRQTFFPTSRSEKTLTIINCDTLLGNMTSQGQPHNEGLEIFVDLPMMPASLEATPSPPPLKRQRTASGEVVMQESTENPDLELPRKPQVSSSSVWSTGDPARSPAQISPGLPMPT